MRQLLANMVDSMLKNEPGKNNESTILKKLAILQEKASQRALYQREFIDGNPLTNNPEKRKLFRKGVLYKTEMAAVIQDGVLVQNRQADLF